MNKDTFHQKFYDMDFSKSYYSHTCHILSVFKNQESALFQMITKVKSVKSEKIRHDKIDLLCDTETSDLIIQGFNPENIESKKETEEDTRYTFHHPEPLNGFGIVFSRIKSDYYFYDELPNDLDEFFEQVMSHTRIEEWKTNQDPLYLLDNLIKHPDYKAKSPRSTLQAVEKIEQELVFQKELYKHFLDLNYSSTSAFRFLSQYRPLHIQSILEII